MQQRCCTAHKHVHIKHYWPLCFQTQRNASNVFASHQTQYPSDSRRLLLKKAQTHCNRVHRGKELQFFSPKNVDETNSSADSERDSFREGSANCRCRIVCMSNWDSTVMNWMPTFSRASSCVWCRAPFSSKTSLDKALFLRRTTRFANPLRLLQRLQGLEVILLTAGAQH